MESKDDKFDVEKELEKIKTPTTQKGDLIIMGSHKLLCASSLDKQALKALFGEDKASAVYSDPPFNIGLSYNKRIGGSKSKKNYGGQINDNLSDDDYVKF
jgi:16S rRNA G966 N2-methylase RsmD